MRVHITVYSKANEEPAQSTWMHARTYAAAELEAHEMRQRCASTKGHACKLDAFVVSKRPEGDWRLKVALSKDFTDG